MHRISFAIAVILVLLGLASSIIGVFGIGDRGGAQALGVGLLLMFGALIFAVLTFAVRPSKSHNQSRTGRA